jgi:hypothetical protein
MQDDDVVCGVITKPSQMPPPMPVPYGHHRDVLILEPSSEGHRRLWPQECDGDLASGVA